MLELFDQSGNLIRLDKELGRGGEGSVYSVSGVNQSSIVAKVYHAPVDQEKSAKLSTMAIVATPQLTRLAAWPTSTLHKNPKGPICGFLMPMVPGKPIHLLYSPKSRLQEFQSAGWAFLVHAAANVARAVATVHEHHHVIGDINQNSFFVSSDARVMLIDCDSLQVAAQGHSFLCEVGVDTYTPPELQGKPFAGIIRTTNHDAFGLAVMIFHLLFMGRHPFSGRYLGNDVKPIERLIAENRFAYGSQANTRQMAPPPGTLPLEAVTANIASMFERAFQTSGNSFGGRPSAVEWVNALSNLSKQLKECSNNKAHQLPSNLSTCPWCAIESKSGITLFGIIHAQVNRSLFDIKVTWSKIVNVASPGPLPQLSNSVLGAYQPAPEYIIAGSKRRACQVMVPLLSLGCFFILYAITGALAIDFVIFGPVCIFGLLASKTFGSSLRESANHLTQPARIQFDQLEHQWKQCGEERFIAYLNDLRAKRDQHEQLTNLRLQKLQALRDNARDRQLKSHLDSFRIQNATIKGIGQGKKSTLQSFGIETAADVELYAVMTVPGFGPSTANNLVNWRRQVEALFVFNANKAINPNDANAIETSIASQQVPLEKALVNGVAELEKIKQEILQRRTSLRPQFENAMSKLAQAEAQERANLSAL